MKRSPETLNAARATAHLAQADARMGALVRRVGPLKMRRERTASIFEALARSIVYQQLHGKAAAAIHARLCALFPSGVPAPEALLALDESALRGAGLSQTKLRSLRDLAERSLDGTVPPIERLRRMSDDEIEERLVKVRGVGPWTAHMILIFRLRRPDVLAAGDFGVRHGFMLTYGKRAMPTPRELERRAEAWRPYRSAACWYLWRAVDLHRARGPRPLPAPK
jgi:DNA-3-methyladenine glycosylase II